MAEMLKGGVTTDVVNIEQARIADDDKTGPVRPRHRVAIQLFMLSAKQSQMRGHYMATGLVTECQLMEKASGDPGSLTRSCPMAPWCGCGRTTPWAAKCFAPPMVYW